MQNYILPYVSALARHAHVFLAFSAPLLHASMCFLGRMCTTVCVLHKLVLLQYSQFYYERLHAAQQGTVNIIKNHLRYGSAQCLLLKIGKHVVNSL